MLQTIVTMSTFPMGPYRWMLLLQLVQRNLEHGEFGQHSLTIDVGETGENDAGQGDRNGDIVRYEVEIDESQWNTYAEFDVVGNGVTLLPITSIDDEFYEPLFLTQYLVH